MRFNNKRINQSLLIMSLEKQAMQAKFIYQQQPKDSETTSCQPDTDDSRLKKTKPC